MAMQLPANVGSEEIKTVRISLVKMIDHIFRGYVLYFFCTEIDRMF